MITNKTEKKDNWNEKRRKNTENRTFCETYTLLFLRRPSNKTYTYTADDETHCMKWKKNLTERKKNNNHRWAQFKQEIVIRLFFVVLCTVHVLCLWATDNRYNLNTMFMLWNELNMGSSDKMANTNLKKSGLWYMQIL